MSISYRSSTLASKVASKANRDTVCPVSTSRLVAGAIDGGAWLKFTLTLMPMPTKTVFSLSQVQLGQDTADLFVPHQHVVRPFDLGLHAAHLCQCVAHGQRTDHRQPLCLSWRQWGAQQQRQQQVRARRCPPGSLQPPAPGALLVGEDDRSFRCPFFCQARGRPTKRVVKTDWMYSVLNLMLPIRPKGITKQPLRQICGAVNQSFAKMAVLQ